MTNSAEQLIRELISRYAVIEVDCKNWEELVLFGGIAMDAATFNAIASAAASYGDMECTIYEMESANTDFSPIHLQLDYKSFLSLRQHAISHLDLLLLPPSKEWMAYLSNDLESFVYGHPEFLTKIGRAKNVILGDQECD